MPSLRNLVKLAVVVWFATYMNAAEAFAVKPDVDTEENNAESQTGRGSQARVCHGMRPACTMRSTLSTHA